MMSYDFVGGITFDLLRTGIPARDDTVRIQHEDRVVRNSTDKQPKLSLAFAQGFEGGATLGDVSCYLGESEQVAGLISDRVNDHGSPEAAAILADTPSLGFVVPRSCSCLQDSSRQTGCSVFLSVKLRKMLPDNLIGRITLQALCTGIPVSDAPAGIEHIDRIVDDTFNQNS